MNVKMAYLWYNNVYQDKNIAILDVRDPSKYILERLRPDIYVIASFSQTMSDPVAIVTKILTDIPEGYNVHRYLYILVNSPEEYTALSQFHDILNIKSWSNSCRTSYDIDDVFTKSIIPHNDRKYTAMMCSKNAKFKRHYLTWGIPNILYTIGADGFPLSVSCDCKKEEDSCQKCIWNTVPLDFIKSKKHESSDIAIKLSPKDLRIKMYDSQCGLILSASEGSCYASLEYLLHGLPVISTPSTGGRSNYYDSSNSIICQPSPKSLVRTINEMKIKCENGDFDPVNIRQNAIKKCNEYRNIYAKVITDIFDQWKIPIDGNEYFKTNILNNFLPSPKKTSDPNHVSDFLQIINSFTPIVPLSPTHSQFIKVFGENNENKCLVWTTIPLEWNDASEKWIHLDTTRSKYIEAGGSVLMVPRHNDLCNYYGDDAVRVYYEGQAYTIRKTDLPNGKFAAFGMYAIAESAVNGKVNLSTKTHSLSPLVRIRL
jgi:hypothetical protein